MNTKEKLDKLADMQAWRDAVELEKQELIDGILTPEIKEQIADIESEFSEKSSEIDKNIADLTKEIKQEVLRSGEKVKGDFLQAVFVKGRKKWDTKGLQGYAKVYPDVLDFFSEGNPSVSIRKV